MLLTEIKLVKVNKARQLGQMRTTIAITDAEVQKLITIFKATKEAYSKTDEVRQKIFNKNKDLLFVFDSGTNELLTNFEFKEVQNALKTGNAIKSTPDKPI